VLGLLAETALEAAIVADSGIESHPGVAALAETVFSETDDAARMRALRTWLHKAAPRDLLAAIFAVHLQGNWDDEAARDSVLSTVSNKAWKVYLDRARKQLEENVKRSGGDMAGPVRDAI
jgi:hypothetical protein